MYIKRKVKMEHNIVLFIDHASISCTCQQVYDIFKELLNIKQDNIIYVKSDTYAEYKTFTIYFHFTLTEYYASNIISILTLLKLNECMVVVYGKNTNECWKIVRKQMFKPFIMTLSDAAEKGYTV